MAKSALQEAIDLKQSIKDFVSPAVASTVGEFVAADPNDIPAPLRPAQAAYRRLCDIHAATGLLGSAGGADILLNPACASYLGPDLPVYTEPEPLITGGQCMTNYNGSARMVINGTPGSTANFTNRPGPLSIRATGNGTTSKGQGLFDRNNSSIVAATDSSPPFDSISVQILSLVRSDGGLDNCGNQPGEGEPSYPPTRTGQPPPSDFTFDDGSGPAVDISIGSVDISAEGTLSLPIDIGGITFDFGGGVPGGGSDRTPTRRPDLDNPGDPIRPGDPGQPEDGVEDDSPVLCFQVVITEVPPGASQEVGGEENIFIEGFQTDAGWARFKLGLGVSPPYRILSRTTIFCYCCGEVVPVGLQVKFSYGFSGYVVVFPIIEE